VTSHLRRRWPDVAFKELVAHSAFGPRFSGSAYADDGNIATLRTTDLDDDGRISYETMPLAHLDEDRFGNHLLAAGDLIITRSGTCGIAAVFESFTLPVLPGAFLLRFRMNERAESRFYRYYFNSQAGRSNILSVARGAVQQNLNITNVETLRVPLPPVSEQQRITNILSAYDSLIENNRRRMALLEQAAQELYCEWFVRLRFPGHEHTRITNGVPQRWERKPVEELTTFLSRGIAPQYDDEADGLVINQKCIRGGRLDLSLARHQSREFKPDRQVQPGDVLVNSTGEGTLGRVAQVLTPIAKCTVDTHVTIVRPTAAIGPHYFGQALMEWEPRFSTMGRGATNQTELSRSQIGGIEILVPAQSLKGQFEEFAAPSFRQVAILMEQNEKLRAARDLLLPRLMSGEIAV
jgi:type I restriction enzyme, S subunit